MKVTLADWKPTKKQLALVNKVLKSGRLTYGPMTRKLEEEFAKIHGKKYCIFTNSGTSALQVAIKYYKEKFGWEDGDEVLVPAVTFVATANVVIHNNLKPVLVDVNASTFNIDPDRIEDKITDKTRAIMPVDLLGQPCEIDKVVAIARKFNLAVIEDSCETMFVKYKGKVVGSQADIACYSSYLAHIISTGVGGFAITNDKRAADYMRSLIWHGRDNLYMSIDANNTVSPERLLHARFKFNLIGFSSRLTELEAALGLEELNRRKSIVKTRQQNAAYLTKKLEKLNISKLINLPVVNKNAEHCWMFYPIVTTLADRDSLALFLEKKGVQTRWIMPLTNQPCYNGLFREKDYPNAQYLNDNGILLGCHQFLTRKHMDYIAKCIKEYFDEQ